MKARPERLNRYFTFLKRLRAGGRTNMYGAVPYLAAAFSLGREDAFRIVCEWIDIQAELPSTPTRRACPVPAVESEPERTLFDPVPPAENLAAKERRPVKKSMGPLTHSASSFRDIAADGEERTIKPRNKLASGTRLAS